MEENIKKDYLRQQLGDKLAKQSRERHELWARCFYRKYGGTDDMGSEDTPSDKERRSLYIKPYEELMMLSKLESIVLGKSIEDCDPDSINLYEAPEEEDDDALSDFWDPEILEKRDGEASPPPKKYALRKNPLPEAKVVVKKLPDSLVKKFLPIHESQNSFPKRVTRNSQDGSSFDVSSAAATSSDKQCQLNPCKVPLNCLKETQRRLRTPKQEKVPMSVSELETDFISSDIVPVRRRPRKNVQSQPQTFKHKKDSASTNELERESNFSGVRTLWSPKKNIQSQTPKREKGQASDSEIVMDSDPSDIKVPVRQSLKKSVESPLWTPKLEKCHASHVMEMDPHSSYAVPVRRNLRKSKKLHLQTSKCKKGCTSASEIETDSDSSDFVPLCEIRRINLHSGKTLPLGSNDKFKCSESNIRSDQMHDVSEKDHCTRTLGIPAYKQQTNPKVATKAIRKGSLIDSKRAAPVCAKEEYVSSESCASTFVVVENAGRRQKIGRDQTKQIDLLSGHLDGPPNDKNTTESRQSFFELRNSMNTIPWQSLATSDVGMSSDFSDFVVIHRSPRKDTHSNKTLSLDKNNELYSGEDDCRSNHNNESSGKDHSAGARTTTGQSCRLEVRKTKFKNDTKLNSPEDDAIILAEEREAKQQKNKDIVRKFSTTSKAVNTTSSSSYGDGSTFQHKSPNTKPISGNFLQESQSETHFPNLATTTSQKPIPSSSRTPRRVNFTTLLGKGAVSNVDHNYQGKSADYPSAVSSSETLLLQVDREYGGDTCPTHHERESREAKCHSFRQRFPFTSDNHLSTSSASEAEMATDFDDNNNLELHTWNTQSQQNSKMAGGLKGVKATKTKSSCVVGHPSLVSEYKFSACSASKSEIELDLAIKENDMLSTLNTKNRQNFKMAEKFKRGKVTDNKSDHVVVPSSSGSLMLTNHMSSENSCVDGRNLPDPSTSKAKYPQYRNVSPLKKEHGKKENRSQTSLWSPFLVNAFHKLAVEYECFDVESYTEK